MLFLQNTSLPEDPVDHETDPYYVGSSSDIRVNDDEVDGEDIEENNNDDDSDHDHDVDDHDIHDDDDDQFVVVASDIDHIDSIMDHC